MKSSRLTMDTRPTALPDSSVFDEVIGSLPAAETGLLGGKLHGIGYQDGVLADLARGRQIWYRTRYPLDFEGPIATVLISQGGTGDPMGHTEMPHLGTSYARLGFLAINIGHMPSANEMQHRFDRPADLSSPVFRRQRSELHTMPKRPFLCPRTSLVYGKMIGSATAYEDSRCRIHRFDLDAGRTSIKSE